MKLGEVAHMRTGDKGDTFNISLIPYDEDDYEWIKTQVTRDRVAELYAPVVHGDVTRYEVPGLRSLNFVCTRGLAGGVSRSLGYDIHGKALSVVLAELDVDPPPGRRARSADEAVPERRRQQEEEPQGRKRLTPRSAGELTGEPARVLRALEDSGNDHVIMRMLANSPNGFLPYVQMSNALLNRASLPARQRELAILHIAGRIGATYEWAEHVHMSSAAGVSDREREAILAGVLTAELFSEEDLLAMRLAEELLQRHRVDQEHWDTAIEHWGIEGCLDLVMTAGWWGGFVPVLISALELTASDATRRGPAGGGSGP